VIALVGYTNAGKSTLFNHLTGAGVMAEDLLFATLDPTMRRIRLPGVDKAILSDTVGFISDLPTQLVAAFRATLEEVTAADVIVHVRDIANPDSSQQKAEVLGILADLGLTEEDGSAAKVPIVEAWNKWDLLDAERAAELSERIKARRDEVIVPVSALTGLGCTELLEAVSKLLTQGARLHTFVLPVSDGQRLAWLHAHGEVLSDEDAGQDERGPLRRLEVRLEPRELGRFTRL
jgi:GTP-binding protein HflX